MKVSVLICTRNRAGSLKRTLDTVQALVVPEGVETEVLVIDNRSTDDTAAVVRQFDTFQYVLEERVGQCHGRNTGMARCTGEVILFTDDDVLLPPNWVAALSEPIVDGKAECVGGAVRLAPHLDKPWMEPIHRYWLASTEYVSPDDPFMIGASMAFSRKVLETVPGFDVELGPGQLGCADDTLFSRQVREAGMRIALCNDAIGEHHPDADRLTRAGLLRAAAVIGRSHAYVDYHWFHQDVAAETVVGGLRRRASRLRWRTASWLTPPACQNELLVVERQERRAYLATQAGQPRKYDHKGMVKKQTAALMASAAPGTRDRH